METITSGRALKCKSIGGVDKVYLMNYTKHLRSQISVVHSVLEYFPSTDYYLFESWNQVSLSQVMSEDDGGKFYNVSFSLDLELLIDIENYLNNEYRAVIVDRQNNYRIVGLYNGIECTRIERVSGSSKTDFNGTRLSFEGREKYEAPFISDLTFLDKGYILQEDGSYILQEDSSKIEI